MKAELLKIQDECNKTLEQFANNEIKHREELKNIKQNYETTIKELNDKKSSLEVEVYYSIGNESNVKSR